MTFRPEAVDDFLTLFHDAAERIRSFEGCRHLELWQDADHPHVFTTYSLWSDATALERYRQSALFRSAWKPAKALFALPPKASSYVQARKSSSDTSDVQRYE